MSLTFGRVEISLKSSKGLICLGWSTKAENCLHGRMRNLTKILHWCPVMSPVVFDVKVMFVPVCLFRGRGEATPDLEGGIWHLFRSITQLTIVNIIFDLTTTRSSNKGMVV